MPLKRYQPQPIIDGRAQLFKTADDDIHAYRVQASKADPMADRLFIRCMILCVPDRGAAPGANCLHASMIGILTAWR